METKEKTIKPAGCFKSYEEYEAQFPEKEMSVSIDASIFIKDVEPKRIKLRKLDVGKIHTISVDGIFTLFFNNYTELCTFAHAITDKVAEIAPDEDMLRDAEDYKEEGKGSWVKEGL